MREYYIKMEPKNIKEARKLVERYRAITIEKINKAWNERDFDCGNKAANKLTGYGNTQSCTLCRAVDENCNQCIYANTGNSCVEGNSEDTFFAIYVARTPEALLSAFRKRADYIENLLKKIDR